MDPDFQKTPSLVWTLLRADTSILGKLMQHIVFLKGLEQKLDAFLGSTLNKHCRIANYANNTLVLHADTPSWASKIRLNTPQILHYLQKECNLVSLKTIRIRVIPAPVQAAMLPDKRWKLDKHTANLISQFALSVTDEALKRSLLKISKHYQNCS